MEESHASSIDQTISRAMETLVNVTPILPTRQSIASVMPTIEEACLRGYFLPDEDDEVRELFSRYLTVRAALQSTLDDLRPTALAQLAMPEPDQPELFVVAYCAASLLVTSGRFLVENFRHRPVVWKKLNKAEPRFGIPRKQYTRIYRSLTSPANAWIFREATNCWLQNKDRWKAKLADNEQIQPILQTIESLEPALSSNDSWYPRRRMRYRLHSVLRRNHSGFKNITFGLFRISGSLVAELRLKWKRKRVTPAVQRKFSKLMRPGDVLVTRHDDAASNLFLPGFWPHAALVLGDQSHRNEIGLEIPSVHQIHDDSICILEARKDGVLLRDLKDTLAVDACTLIRPKLSNEDICRSLIRAVSHAGKPYDFEFDFRRSDKLVCTEVVYRAYHGCPPFQFQLTPRMGRVCLSAEDLLDSVFEQDWFDVVAIYGVNGNRFATGERARSLLESSYRQ